MYFNFAFLLYFRFFIIIIAINPNIETYHFDSIFNIQYCNWVYEIKVRNWMLWYDNKWYWKLTLLNEVVLNYTISKTASKSKFSAFSTNFAHILPLTSYWNFTYGVEKL